MMAPSLDEIPTHWDEMDRKDATFLIMTMIDHYHYHPQKVQDVQFIINQYYKGHVMMNDVRAYAVELHRQARLCDQLKERYFMRALAHALSTIHVKEHALKCLLYLKKFLGEDA